MRVITLPAITSPEETAEIGRRLDALQRVIMADAERRKQARELRRLRRIAATVTTKPAAITPNR